MFFGTILLSSGSDQVQEDRNVPRVKMEFFAESIKGENQLDVTFIVEANSGKIQIQSISLLARQLVY